ncbi:MAG: TIGR01212 family radical SAM protein [Desulfobacterales bacterium]|nr:TIGR01212 family radical SAM protein [Desulfobacterales bacterium]
MDKRYNDLNSYLKNIFGCRVQKITVDAGLTCPNRDGKISHDGCIYCNSKGSGTGAYSKGLSVKDQILMGRSALSKRYKAKKFIVYFQSFSNTYAPLDKLVSIYEEALAINDVVGISIGTRPDCINEDILSVLESYTKKHLIWIEYGLQSAYDDTLKFINRGHDFSCFENAVRITKNRGIKICVHLILGLPHETKEQMIDTAKIIGKIGINGIKLHLLYVIKGTKMEDLLLEGKYRCLNQEEYVDIVCDFLQYIPYDIVVQRLTGDPHKDELTEPLWSLNKAETLTLIKDRLEQRDIWQGKLFSY